MGGEMIRESLWYFSHIFEVEYKSYDINFIFCGFL